MNYFNIAMIYILCYFNRVMLNNQNSRYEKKKNPIKQILRKLCIILIFTN